VKSSIDRLSGTLQARKTERFGKFVNPPYNPAPQDLHPASIVLLRHRENLAPSPGGILLRQGRGMKAVKSEVFRQVDKIESSLQKV
jgi:hypothetical protein